MGPFELQVGPTSKFKLGGRAGRRDGASRLANVPGTGLAGQLEVTPAARELAAGKHDSQPGELGPAATWPAPAQGPHGGHGGSYYQQRN